METLVGILKLLKCILQSFFDTSNLTLSRLKNLYVTRQRPNCVDARDPSFHKFAILHSGDMSQASNHGGSSQWDEMLSMNVCQSQLTYDDAFDLNNLAITYFQQGYHDCAVQCLTAILSEFCMLQPVFNEGLAKSGERHSSTGQTTVAPLRSNHMRWVAICEAGINGQMSIYGPSVYGYAVMISTDRKHLASEISLQEISAIVMYNLALFHHCQAINQCNSSGLLTALDRYEHVGEVIQQLGLGKAGIDHLVLAVLNNMGHIHFQLLQFKEARQCFSCLRSQISIKIASLSRLQSIEDYGIFVLSAMLPVSELLLAPAA